MAVKSTNYQVGLSNTNSQNFNIRTGLDGTLRIYRGSDTLELNEVLRIDANGNLSANGILGSGQTWQNVSASRAAGVTYTNTTGKPIVIAPSLQHGGGSFFVATITINGVLVGNMNSGNATYSQVFPYTFIVPAGGTYQLSITGGGGSVNYWAELR